MKYLLGIDLGTSGTKSVLFKTDGNAVASDTQEYDIMQPQNGWAEQEPETWWEATSITIQNVLNKSGIAADDIVGIGISGQMHGLVMMDSIGKVVRPAILWCDGRTSKQCDYITEKIGKQRLIEINANPALTGFTAGKILWVREHEPNNFNRCKKILLPKDYLRYKLTGVYATDISDASGTNLLDITNRCWSQEIIEKLDITFDLLPKIYESSEVTGRISKQASIETGLKEGTIVVGGAADNMAAAIGTGIVAEGNAFTTIGTSGVVFAHSDHVAIDPLGRVHTFCAAVPGAWNVMSCTLSAGMSLKWFRDNFCNEEKQQAAIRQIDPYVLMDEEANNIPIGADKLIFLPYLMGERSPILDENARGVFCGLSGVHTKAHLIRSIMEGVIYSQCQCLEILAEMGIKPAQMLACGGGGKSGLWRQMMADVYDCPVTTLTNDQGPALGVAILAGVGAGIYSTVQDACKTIVKKKLATNPISSNTKLYKPYYNLYCNLYSEMKNAFYMLSKI